MSARRMAGKIVLVTGATAGIGKVCARELARLGAQVVIVGRNPQKTAAVLGELREDSGNPHLDSLLADLSKLSDVKQLAEAFRAKYERLDVLLNNAGAVNMRRELTADGYELTFAVNHLAYFALANLLLPALEKSGRARVVNVSSAAHRVGALDFDDLMSERSYRAFLTYGRSKLANILFTRALARRVASKGITVNALHPGFVASNFLQKDGVWRLLRPLAYLFAIDETKGARTAVYLASSHEVEGVSGKYFAKCKEARVSRWAKDDAAAERLWNVSEKLTGITALA